MSDLNRFGISNQRVYRIGHIAALLQLAIIAIFAVLTALLGTRPGDIQETYRLFIEAP